MIKNSLDTLVFYGWNIVLHTKQQQPISGSEWRRGRPLQRQRRRQLGGGGGAPRRHHHHGGQRPAEDPQKGLRPVQAGHHGQAAAAPAEGEGVEGAQGGEPGEDYKMLII